MPIRGLEITHIRLLASLMETKSLAGSAREIHLSSSAASHALAKMRKLLGDPLFILSREGLVPTSHGHQISTAARQAMEVLSAGLAVQPAFEPGSTRRRFSAYLSQAGQILFLPQLTKLMQKEAPDASIRALQIPLENPGRQLASGEVDLAVGFFKTLVGGFHSALLRREKYVCVVRRDDPRFVTGMTMTSFLAAPHAVWEASGRAHGEVNRAFEKGGVKRKAKVLVPEGGLVPLLLAETDLVATLPSCLATYLASHLPVKVLPAPILLPTAVISIYWHERYHRDPANKWFRQVFLRLFRERSGERMPRRT